MALLIIIAFALIIFFQVPGLLRAHKKKELAWFCVFTLVGFALCMILNADVKIPGPIKQVIKFMDMIGLHY
jgi:hypothetical protein